MKIDQLEAFETSFAHKWMRNGLEGDYLDDDEELEVEFGEEKTGFGEVVSEEKFNLSSAFSVTTTSTSNYIDVEMSDSHDENSESWSTLEAPNTPGFSRLLFREERHSAGLLRKRRPPNNSNNFVTDASPPDSLRSFKRKAIPGFLRNIGLRRLRP
ncbi:hypothetical protein C0991_003337 [Blastosporella zonata]|nr:hypothetical protein C0991_003337 [Blastosporella zonata]